MIDVKEITFADTDFIFVRIGATKKEWKKIKVSEEWKKILTGNVGEEKTLSENFAKNMADSLMESHAQFFKADSRGVEISEKKQRTILKEKINQTINCIADNIINGQCAMEVEPQVISALADLVRVRADMI